MSQANFFCNLSIRRALLTAPVLFFTAAAFAQSPAGVHNFHIVNEHIYRGGQPTAEGFQNLAKLGVKTVIDLRADETAIAEKKEVEAAGMRFIQIPMHGMEMPADASVQQVLALFNNQAAGPVFVHCKRGADRTGTVVACYRVTHDHWDNRKALDEAKSLGMSFMQIAMHHYVMNYRPTVENVSAPTIEKASAQRAEAAPAQASPAGAVN